MPSKDTPRGNSMAGVPKRVQTPVPNSDIRAGSLKRHLRPPGRSRKLFLYFLRMRGFHSKSQRPGSLSATQEVGMELGFIMCDFEVNSQIMSQ